MILYCGEANVFQENLDSFLAIAEEMKLKGLTGQQEMSNENIKPMPSTMITRPSLKSEESNLNTGQRNYVSKTAHAFSELNEDRTISAQDFVAGDLQELDEKVKSMHYRLRCPLGRFLAKICSKVRSYFSVKKRYFCQNQVISEKVMTQIFDPKICSKHL